MAADSRASKRAQTSKESDGFVRSIARGLAVVEALGHPPGRHTLSEVARIADITRATSRRILATLVALKYCATDGRYFQLRPRSLGLGLSYLNSLPFWASSTRTIENLRDETLESCALAVLDETEIVYVQRWPARRILATNLGVGSRLPAHVISLGRILLAAAPAEELDRFLDTVELRRLTPRTIVEPKALRRELVKIAAQGYAWVDGELDPAICGLAVPIRNPRGEVLAAISINTLSGTISEARAKRRFLRSLQQAAQDIQMHMAA